MGDPLDERVRRQEFGEAATERTGAVAVNDADTRFAGERGSVEELVHAARGFFDGAADDVDFVGGGFLGGLRMHCDVAARPDGRVFFRRGVWQYVSTRRIAYCAA